jgi:hypothetical protein
VLTVAGLLAADPGRVAEAGRAWRGLAESLGTRTAELDRRLDELRAAWTGPAARAATGMIGGVCAELDAAYPTLLGVEQALAEHAATVARAQQIALSATAYAGCARITIGAGGTATVDRTGEKPDAGDLATADQVTIDLHRALDLAERSDQATATRLGDLGPGRSVPAHTGPSRTDPSTVADWWRGLSDAERRWLVEERPELVGGLDGVPAVDRDLANRVRLTRLLADPHGRHANALRAIQARLDAAGPPRAYLLGLSSDGQGRAIVALGDPDTADNVVTYVPGLGGDVDGAADELVRIGHLSTAAGRAAPGRSTAVIAWLGYAAPTSLVEAARPGAAVGAEPALHRFQVGLRATHHGAASHNTVLGLSYGSTVAGLTGHGPGLVADDLVLIGSPGAGVAHATDLGLDPRHVWASTARYDVINAAVNPLHPPGLWYGPSPSGPSFGAHVFTSAPGNWADPLGTHMAYFDDGNPSLTNLADIAVADYADVR